MNLQVYCDQTISKASIIRQCLLLTAPIWWFLEELFWFQQSYRSSLVLIFSSLAILNNTLWFLFIKRDKASPMWNLMFSLLNTAFMIEISVQAQLKNPFQVQTTGIIHVLNYQQLHLQIISKPLALMASLPLYGLVRLSLQGYLDANIFIIESIFTLLSFSLLVLTQSKEIEAMDLHQQQLNIARSPRITSLQSQNRKIDENIRESPDFVASQRERSAFRIEPANMADSKIPFIKTVAMKRSTKQRKSTIRKMASIRHQESIQIDLESKNTQSVQNFYQGLLNSFPQGIVLIDSKEEIIFTNSHCEKLLGCETREHIKEKMVDVIIQSTIINQAEKGVKRNKNMNSKIYMDIVKTAQLSNSRVDLLDNLLNPKHFSSLLSPLSESRKSNAFYHSQSIISQDIATGNPSITLRYDAPGPRPRYLKIQIHLCGMREPVTDFEQGLSSGQGDQKPMLLLIIKNISSKLILQKIRKQYEFQNSLLQSFSHELRTPLNCSIQLLSIVRELVKEDTEVSKYVRSAQASNQLLSYQINDILDFAAFECNNFQYKWESILFKDLVDEVIKIYQDSCEEKQIQLTHKVDSALNDYRLSTDPSRVLQVLVNLMNNAIKFTNMGGKITIKGKLYDNINGRMIRVEIKDNGIGLRSDQLIQIQDQLKQNLGMVESMHRSKKQSPIGLGVTISNKIIQGLADIQNNHLKMVSAQNKGTKVFFFIRHHASEGNANGSNLNPMIDSPAQKKENKRSQFFFQSKVQDDLVVEPTGQNTEVQPRDELDYLNSGRSGNVQRDIVIPKLPMLCFENFRNNLSGIQNQRETPSVQNIDLKRSETYQQQQVCSECVNVLIVDDVPFNQLALKAMLKYYKLDCDQAHDGRQAIQLVNSKLKNHCKTYKLIFMDIEMPGMNGFQTSSEILKLLAAQQLSTVIVMCSAYDTADNFEKARSIGMLDVITKPVRKQLLEKTIHKFLHW